MSKYWFQHALVQGHLVDSSTKSSQLPQLSISSIELALSTINSHSVFIIYVEKTILFLGFVPKRFLADLNSGSLDINAFETYVLNEFQVNYPKLSFQVSHVDGSVSSEKGFKPIHLLDFSSVAYFGTEFQSEIWSGLIHYLSHDQQSTSLKGLKSMNYSDFASKLNKAQSVRAVASAIAKNPVSGLIPCHCIIPKQGKSVGQYRWGSDIKQSLLSS